jgi:RNA-directed DNA polymerase
MAGTVRRTTRMGQLLSYRQRHDKFVQIDDYVCMRLRSLLVKRKGRNLRAGEAQRWTRDWVRRWGLHRLMGTTRYPGTA